MKKYLTNKDARVNILIVLFIITISMVYFSPTLTGKKIMQPDIIFYKGMNKELRDYKKAEGREALWTNSMFGGMPSYLISAGYPGNVLSGLQSSFRKVFHPAAMLILYIFGFYLLLITLGVNKWTSLVGAIAYGFSSYLIIIIGAGHNTKAYTIGYMAPMIAGALMSFKGKNLSGVLLFTFSLSLQLIANHLQITYYTLILLVLLGTVQLGYAIKEKEILSFFRTVGILALGSILAIGMNFSRIYTIWEYSKQTVRSESELVVNEEDMTTGLNKSYITEYSQGIGETLTLLIPNFKGGATSDHPMPNSEAYNAIKKSENSFESKLGMVSYYHGEKPNTAGPVYFGAIVVFLFILSLFVVNGVYKWWLLLATILSIVLSWGKNVMGLTDLLLEYLPLYNKFRAPEMILIIAGFTVPLLGFIGLNKIITKQVSEKKFINALFISFAITGGITLLFSVFPRLSGDFYSSLDQMRYPLYLKDSLINDRIELLRNDSIRSFLFIVVATGLLYFWHKGKLKSYGLIILLGLTILIDLWLVDRRYLNDKNFRVVGQESNVYVPTYADNEILKDQDINYRVIDLRNPFRDSRTSYFHKNIGGYHAAKLSGYQDLMDIHLKNEIDLIKKEFETNEELNNIFMKLPVLNMLNTKYIIRDLKKPPVYNPYAFGNAWFVNRYWTVEDAKKEIISLSLLDPKYIAIIDKRFKDFIINKNFIRDKNAVIKLIDYKPDYLKYIYRTATEQLVVFSEIYYKDGWKSFIDGESVPHFKADYVLRAMVVPAGEHVVEFKFEPKSYYLGIKISYISSFVFIIAVIMMFFFPLKGRGFVKKFIVKPSNEKG